MQAIRRIVRIHLIRRSSRTGTYFRTAKRTSRRSFLPAPALLATLLSATSVYSIVAYAMAERSRELAIRRTLGATAPEVWRFGTSDTAWCLAIGLVLGIAAAGASTTVIEGALWGVTRSDVVTYAGAGIVMIGAGLSAMAIPVRRILRTSPVALSKAE